MVSRPCEYRRLWRAFQNSEPCAACNLPIEYAVRGAVAVEWRPGTEVMLVLHRSCQAEPWRPDADDMEVLIEEGRT